MNWNTNPTNKVVVDPVGPAPTATVMTTQPSGYSYPQQSGYSYPQQSGYSYPQQSGYGYAHPPVVIEQPTPYAYQPEVILQKSDPYSGYCGPKEIVIIDDHHHGHHDYGHYGHHGYGHYGYGHHGYSHHGHHDHHGHHGFWPC